MVTNEELVQQALSGDQDAYTELHKRMVALASKLVYKKLDDHPDRQEAPYDIATHILLRLDKFKGESKFSSWATRIAINQIYMLWRDTKKRIINHFSLDTPIGDDDSSTLGNTIAYEASTYEQVDARIDVEHVMQKLPEHYRTVLEARYIYGKDHQEVIKDLGILLGSSRNQQVRGLALAQDIMNGYRHEAVVDASYRLPQTLR